LTPPIYNVYTLFVDRHIELGSLEFVWDEDKASANFAKHGVRFEEAYEVFFDPLLRVFDASITDEAREAIIGETEHGSLLFVVHIEVENETIRIISARPATAAERDHYEEYA
jgi:uncharacterized DUF497 family protein